MVLLSPGCLGYRCPCCLGTQGSLHTSPAAKALACACTQFRIVDLPQAFRAQHVSGCLRPQPSHAARPVVWLDPFQELGHGFIRALLQLREAQGQGADREVLGSHVDHHLDIPGALWAYAYTAKGLKRKTCDTCVYLDSWPFEDV